MDALSVPCPEIELSAPIVIVTNGRVREAEECLGAEAIARLKQTQREEMDRLVQEDLAETERESRERCQRGEIEKAEHLAAKRVCEVTEGSATPRWEGLARAHRVEKKPEENGGVELRRYLWGHDPLVMPADMHLEIWDDDELMDLPPDVSGLSRTRPRKEVEADQRRKWRARVEEIKRSHDSDPNDY